MAMAASDPRRLLLLAIATFKFIKAALLAAVGIGALRLVHHDIFEFATGLVGKFHLNPGSHFVVEALARATNVTPRRLHELGIAAFVYSALFLTEGIGLWSLKRWGEWVTVLITGSLLPFEIYELWHRFTFPKVVVLALNAAILWYLVVRLRSGGGARRGSVRN
jgi:uncharacterized membrane protein (DUF2068 family)